MANMPNVMRLFETSEKYIRELKTKDGTPVLQTNIRRGFQGFLVNIDTFKAMYLELVEARYIDFLLTYKCSQDHLELFFSTIRGRYGYMNNPSAREFMVSYKKCLIHQSIKISGRTNCLLVENKLDDQNSCHAIQQMINEKPDDQSQFESIELSDFEFQDNKYVHDVVSYIAGFIQRKIRTCLRCDCVKIFQQAERGSHQDLIQCKSYGNLERPIADVITVCIAAEKSFRMVIGTLRDRPNKAKYFITAMRLIPTHVFSQSQFIEHCYDQDPIDNHRNLLITAIIESYFKIKIKHFCRIETIESRNKFVRNQYTKLIHFEGQ